MLTLFSTRPAGGASSSGVGNRISRIFLGGTVIADVGLGVPAKARPHDQDIMFSLANSLPAARAFHTKFCTEVSAALRSGREVSDSIFDLCLPVDLQPASARHWTPIDVARRASEWIEQMRMRTVVDIGAGAGKFCITAALLSSARFLGIEHRPRLVSASRALAESFRVDGHVTFEWGVIGRRPIPRADAYYLYNPFGENLSPHANQIDQDVQLNRARYEYDVEWVRQFFHGVPLGTYVITYNGYGALLPSSFIDIRVDREHGRALRLSKKVSGS